MLKLNSSQANLRFTVFALLATFALLTSVAFAQTTVSTGSIVGTVTDASGAVVPNAKVTITGSTGQVVKTTTNGQGGYSTGSLVPGVYTVRIGSKRLQDHAIARGCEGGHDGQRERETRNRPGKHSR